jgi:hypothetical protein
MLAFFQCIKNYAPAEEIRVRYRRESGNGWCTLLEGELGRSSDVEADECEMIAGS